MRKTAMTQDRDKDVSGDYFSVTLENYDQRLIVNGLVEFKNDLERQNKPSEEVADLIVKVIDAPPATEKRHGRETR